MTMPSSVDTVIVTEGQGTSEFRDYVDWPAIIAGIVLASAISLVLLTFGSAVGLSFANFRGGSGVSPVWIGIAAASWLLWVEVSSLMAGGYITGRLRRRINDATEHEVDVRDGAHGLLVWAGALVLGAVIAATGIGATITAIGSVAGTAATAASASKFDPQAYFTDALFRQPATAPAAAPAATAADAKAEAGRILAAGAVAGSIAEDDKAYLATLVARNTGLSPADAKARVDGVLAEADAAKAKAAETAETARKTSVLAAFLTAASLLVSAIGAYWAAHVGGRHRDEQVVFHDWFHRF